jgi:hypothetical protein
MERAGRTALVLGLLVLGFGYGFVARGWSLPPHQQLKPVGDAVRAVAVDPATRSGRWEMHGPFGRQHDPELLPNGHPVPFDNLGGDRAVGRGRIPRIDPITQDIVWSYGGSRGGQRFASGAWGEQQPLPSVNVLIAEGMAGRVIEVTREPNPHTAWSHGDRNSGSARGGVAAGAAHRFAPQELPLPDDRAFAEGNERATVTAGPRT